MKTTLKKHLALIGILSICLTSSGYSSQNQTPAVSSKDTTSAANQRANVSFTADFIYWNTIEHATALGLTGVRFTLPPAPSVHQGRLVELGHAWSPGFKVGCDVNLPYGGWDLYANYTWLYSNNHEHMSRSPNGIGPSTILPNFLADKAKGDWHHHFNVIDLELGRYFEVIPSLSLRPFIGLKGTWQTREIKRKYQTFLLRQNYVHNDELSVWGMGIRGGLNTKWTFAKNWNFFGNFASTSMWSCYHKLTRKDTITNTQILVKTIVVDVDGETQYGMNYIGEFEIGLGWEKGFRNDKYHLSLQAGWEEQLWINYMTLIELYDEVWSDLAFHGLNIKVRFDF